MMENFNIHMVLHWLKQATPSNSNRQQTELAVTGGMRLDLEGTELGNCWVFMMNGSYIRSIFKTDLSLGLSKYVEIGGPKGNLRFRD